MIQAAPLIISFARVVPMLNKLIGAVGITELGNRVNNYIQENPDESEKIFQMIMPSQGIANILKNKSDDGEEISEEELGEIETPKLTGKEKGKAMADTADSKTGNYSDPNASDGYASKRGRMIKKAEDLGLANPDLKDNYKPSGYTGWKKFANKYKKKYADGGAIGIEVLFEEKKDGGRAGSTMKPKRGLVNEPGGYAGLTTQQEALLNLQLQNDPEFQTGYYKATPELEFEDFYKAPTGPLGYVDKVEGSSSFFDEDIEKLNFQPRGPLRDLDMDRTMGIINALDIKDPSGELGFNYMDRIKSNPDGGIYETIQTNTPKFSEFQEIPEDRMTKDMTPLNFKNLNSTNQKGVYGYTTLPGILPSEYGTKFQTETNPVYLNKNLAEFITTKPMSPANQLPLYSDKVAQLGLYGATPANLMNQAIDTIQHEYAHNITKLPQFAGVMKNTMDAGVPSGLQLKGKPGDGISKFDKEELFTRAIDIERRFNKDKNLNSPNIENDLAYMNKVLNKKYKNLNKDGQSMAIQYLNSIQPQVQDYFNTINQRATANRARAANPDVYASADRQGFTDGRGGGFASRSTGTNENFSNKTGRGRTGYDDGGRVGLFMGGDPLTGQALSIYNSMNSYGFSDQEIANALQGQGLYTTPDSNTPETTAPNIIGSQINQGGGGGGGGGGGITTLDPLTRKSTPMDPNSFLGKTFSKIGDFTGSMIDKFSGSKVGQGATKFKNIAFTPMMALMQKRNPLNPNASNYNPNLQPQMNFLEGITGSKITGTSGNLKTTDGLAMIGRDPNSGLAKYGPGSVLSGQNVVSGFGTNDYAQQLQNYIDKMMERRTKGVLSEFQQAKLDAGLKELAAEQERAAAAAAKSAAEEIALAKSYNIGQRGGGAGDSSTSHMGGISQAQADAVGKANKDAGMSGWGLRDGGLATMFKEKR